MSLYRQTFPPCHHVNQQYELTLDCVESDHQLHCDVTQHIHDCAVLVLHQLLSPVDECEVNLNQHAVVSIYTICVLDLLQILTFAQYLLSILTTNHNRTPQNVFYQSSPLVLPSLWLEEQGRHYSKNTLRNWTS
jgi:hypothetical protein